jgi:PAS domain S-box-containing protein
MTEQDKTAEDIQDLVAKMKKKGDELVQANKERLLLEQQWKRAEFIINAAEEYMTLINRDYAYEAANDAYCSAYGAKTCSEVIGKSIYDQWGDVRGLDIKGLIDRCLDGEVVRDNNWYEFPAIGKRYFEVSYYPYRCKEGGGITHVVVVSHDETERKEAEDKLQAINVALLKKIEELRDTCRVFEQFLYYSPVAVYLKDDQLRIVKVSKKYAEKAKAGNADDLIGKSNIEIWGETFGLQLDTEDTVVLTTKEPKIFEESIDGEKYISTKFYIEIKGKARLGGFTMGPIESAVD